MVRHTGLARTWLLGMLLSVLAFSAAFVLGAGDTLAQLGNRGLAALGVFLDEDFARDFLHRQIGGGGLDGALAGRVLGRFGGLAHGLFLHP